MTRLALRLAPWAALVIAGALVAAAGWRVDLRPEVGRGFFFAPESGVMQDVRRIDAEFGSQTQLVVIARAPDISSESYRDAIETLTAGLSDLPGVLTAKSLTEGPDDLEDARESPLWSRMLLSGDGSSTRIVALVEDPWPEALIPRARELLARVEGPDLRLSLAGVPYTVTVMREQLVRDFRVFGAVAIGVFALASLVLFRSLRVSVGTLACALAAVASTLLLLVATGAGIGLLTANLVTVVFVLTQSHVIFLTSNYRRAAQEGTGGAGALTHAWRITAGASAASMATTFLGFAALLFVEAKPLRELGQGGVIGTVAALVAAYALYPPFLLGARTAPGARGAAAAGRMDRLAARRATGASAGLALVALAAGLGLLRLETDPSLLAYFDEEGAVHRGLAHLDRHGGSSPLELVVQRADGAPLLEDEGYEQLWGLQRALEEQPTVGRVLSLPVVLAEGERYPLSFLLSKGLMVELLDTSLFDHIAERFITEDRRRTLLVAQMVEHRREANRSEVVAELRRVAQRHGFEVPRVGGIYHLQGQLAERVVASLLQSLAALALLFTAIAWAAAGSLRVALAMTAVLALVPLGTFGAMGLLGAPVDVVAAPAAAVGLGIAADALLHLAAAARRAARAGDAKSPGWTHWVEARREQWPGILRATGIVAAGFALFAFSSFPPTRRFGLAVAGATALAAPLALVLLPRLADALRTRRSSP